MPMRGNQFRSEQFTVANEFLEAQVEELRADVSKGYARGYYHGRFRTYTG
jgi:hypothetical protein